MTRQRHTGQGVCIVVENARAVDDVKVILLQHAGSACMCAFQVSAGHKPFKWLMVSDDGEVSAVQEMAVNLAAPYCSQTLTLVGAVVALMFV